jgi:4-diphosphocytidyl-2-C-methyl-D-erythritol kinase
MFPRPFATTAAPIHPVPGPTEVTLRAPAKVNLSLRVLAKRPDGFHDLETLMVAIGLWDTLRFGVLPADLDDGSIRLAVRVTSGARARHDADRATNAPANSLSANNLSAGTDNLVWKAADLLRREAGVTTGVSIHLEKRIPWQAGLAGGSSDAASTLLGLNRLWGLNWPLEKLRELGATLGSDIPFFLAGSTAAVCRGRGEIVEPVELGRSLPLVVLKPPSGLSTPLVFRHCRPEPAPDSDCAALVDDIRSGNLARGAGRLCNTLQAPAESLNEDVRNTRRAFERLPFLGHRMSGSGTSWFGICRNWSEARTLGARLRACRLGEVFVVRTLV